MRSHLEFTSTAFACIPEEAEQVNLGRFGKRLAEYLSLELPRHGIQVKGTNPEDWGWRVDLENRDFPMWIGCGNYEEYENSFLCFIEPSRPFVRKLLKKVPTAASIERVARAMQAILEGNSAVSNMRWWTEEETRR